MDKHIFFDWLQQLNKATIFSFTLKTNDLNAWHSKLLGFSFAILPGEAVYLPVLNDSLKKPKPLDHIDVLEKLKPILENEKALKIGTNIKFNINVLAHYGINLRGIAYDTMLESYVLGDDKSHNDINKLANQYLHHKIDDSEKIINQGHNKLTFNQINIAQTPSYGTNTADITLRLHLAMWSKLQNIGEIRKVFSEIDMPLVTVLSYIERTGVLIDSAILWMHSQSLTETLNTLAIKAYKLAGEPFNLSSPQQIQKILYDKQKLPVIKKTPRGAPSTNEEVLTQLALHYPLAKVILEYRSQAKLKTTYTDKLPLMIHPISGRIHTSYHQTVTTTGRLTSSNPNLQNIPIRTSEGRRVRQAFIAPKNYLIVTADYSQIELRIIAHLSQDLGLLAAFAEEKDIHCATAAEIFNVPLNQVSREQRRSAKAINFGLIYGMSPFSLAKRLGITQNEAQHYMHRYFQRYSGVLTYIKHARQQAAKNGYISTLGGRRLYLPKVISSSNRMHRKSAERAAINAPMQGTAADIIKRAMIDIYDWIAQQNPPLVRMIMQVHDELVFEVHESVIHVSVEKIRKLMENSMSLTVSLKVEVKIGINWDEAH